MNVTGLIGSSTSIKIHNLVIYSSLHECVVCPPHYTNGASKQKSVSLHAGSSPAHRTHTFLNWKNPKILFELLGCHQDRWWFYLMVSVKIVAVLVSNLFKIGVYEKRRGATTKTARVTIMIWFPKQQQPLTISGECRKNITNMALHIKSF